MPMIILMVLVFLIAIGLSCYEKKTNLSSTLVFFLAPVETVALIVQLVMAVKHEGFRGYSCKREDDTEHSYAPLILYATIIVLLLLYFLNLYYMIFLCCGKKLRTDERF